MRRAGRVAVFAMTADHFGNRLLSVTHQRAAHGRCHVHRASERQCRATDALQDDPFTGIEVALVLLRGERNVVCRTIALGPEWQYTRLHATMPLEFDAQPLELAGAGNAQQQLAALVRDPVRFRRLPQPARMHKRGRMADAHQARREAIQGGLMWGGHNRRPAQIDNGIGQGERREGARLAAAGFGQQPCRTAALIYGRSSDSECGRAGLLVLRFDFEQRFFRPFHDLGRCYCSLRTYP